MKRLIFILSLFTIFALITPAGSSLFGKSCIKMKNSFYHRIIDPDIIEIGNDEYWSFVSVDCDGVSRPHAFSRCANNCPLFPNNSVRIARNKTKICTGDIIFIGGDECSLGKIKAEPWK